MLQSEGQHGPGALIEHGLDTGISLKGGHYVHANIR